MKVENSVSVPVISIYFAAQRFSLILVAGGFYAALMPTISANVLDPEGTRCQNIFAITKL